MDTMKKLTWTQRGLLIMAEKEAKKAAKRGTLPRLKLTSAKDVAFLETYGWRVHSHSAPSYVSAERWWMTI